MTDKRRRLAVVGTSSLVPAAALVSMVLACHHQLIELAEGWGRVAPVVLAVDDPSKLGPGDEPCFLRDEISIPGALGDHSEDDDGKPTSEVGVGLALVNGGSLLSGPGAVSVTLSHELAELFLNPQTNEWASSDDGWFYAAEACDWVEGSAYPLMVAGVSVHVSDFLWPSAFDAHPPSGVAFDRMGHLTAPFQVEATGYAIRANGGDVEEFFGDAFPKWKRPYKRAARYAALMRSAHGLADNRRRA